MADDLELMAEEDAEGQPDLAVLLERAMTGAAERMHTAAPGVISSASSSGKVFARQAVSRSGATDDEPITPDVPLLQIRCAKGGLSLPVAAGDPCLLVHSNRSLDEWAQTDGTLAVKPADPRAHDPSDALALPAAPGARPTGAGDAVVLDGDEVRLGAATATEAAILGTSMLAALRAYVTAIQPFADPPGAATAALTTLIDIAAGNPGALKSAKVKVG